MSEDQVIPPKTDADKAVATVEETQTKKRAHPAYRGFKGLFWILVIIPAVLILGFWGAIQFIDFNQYKPQIEQAFYEKTGHTLQIEGPVEVGVFPFTVKANQVIVESHEKASKIPMASIKAVEAEFSLWSLFIERKLNVEGLELDQPIIHMTVDDQGVSNWQQLQSLLQQKVVHPFQDTGFGFHKVSYQPVANEIDKTVDVHAENSKNDWYLNTLIIRKGSLFWKDLNTETHWQLSQVDYMGFDLQSQKPFQSMTSFEFQQDPKVRFHVELSGDVQLSTGFKQMALSDWQGNIKAVWLKEKQRPPVRLQTDGEQLVLDTQSKTITTHHARWSSNQGWWETSLTYGYGGEPHSTGRFKSGGINLRHWLTQSGAPVPKFVDANVLKKMALSFQWTWNHDQWVVEKLKMVWDKSQLDGRFWAQQGDLTPVHFEVNLDQLDLDQYQALAEANHKTITPPTQKEAINKGSKKNAAEPQPSTPSSDESGTKKSEPLLTETYIPLALPIDFLRSLKAEGSLKIGQLKAWGLTFHSLDTTLLAQKGQLDFAPLDAKLYKGSLASKLAVSVVGVTPAYSWSGKADSIDVGSFLNDGWQQAPVSGRFSSHFELNTRGVNDQLFKQNLNGRFLGEIQNGAVNGMDLNKLLAGKTSSDKDATAFSNMTVDGKLVKGLYDINTFVVKSQRFDASGAGKLNLPSAQLNAKLFAVYRQPPSSLNHLKGMEIPLELTGPVDAIQWRVNLERVLNRPENQKKLMDTLQKFLAPR